MLFAYLLIPRGALWRLITCELPSTYLQINDSVLWRLNSSELPADVCDGRTAWMMSAYLLITERVYDQLFIDVIASVGLPSTRSLITDVALWQSDSSGNLANLTSQTLMLTTTVVNCHVGNLNIFKWEWFNWIKIDNSKKKYYVWSA